MKLVDALLQELQQFGVKQLFGIPGDFVLPLFEQLQQRNSLPLYYLSHEPSAVFAADAAARISNRPAVVILTYGAGALNAVNAVAQAYVEHVPLVVIAGFPSKTEIDRGLLIHHQAKTVDSQRDIYREITACQVRLSNPASAGLDIRLALKTAVEKSQPVLIEIPRDAVQFDTTLPAPYRRPSAPEAELQLAATHLAERLKQAKRPVILAGVDVRRFNAVAQLEQLAQQLGIPLLSTLMGRACLDNQHPTYSGIFLDQSDKRPTALLQQADLIIQIGVIKTDSNFAANSALFPADKVVELQQNRAQIGPATYHQLPLNALLQAVNTAAIPAFTDATALSLPETAVSIVSCPQPDNTGEVAAIPLTATGVVAALDHTLSQGKAVIPFISDIGDCLFASLHAKPSLMLAPAFYASMGYAVPAAFGVQAVTGLRPVVLVGDGAFLMTGLELGHCARYGFSPIVILFNNSRWDMINAFSPQLTCTDLHNWHYAKLAQAMGGSGYQVVDIAQFNDALQQALVDNSRFSLIEVQLQAGSRTDRLNRFAEGFLNAGKNGPLCA